MLLLTKHLIIYKYCLSIKKDKKMAFGMQLLQITNCSFNINYKPYPILKSTISSNNSKSKNIN